MFNSKKKTLHKIHGISGISNSVDNLHEYAHEDLNCGKQNKALDYQSVRRLWEARHPD
jgi:hypothetical protein